MGSKRQYKNRMQTVCDYIYAHLDEDLTVEDLSRVANFSKYHFHRQFSLYMGLNVFKFIQQLRLKRAAYELVFNPDKRITDIAMDAHFEFPESFSRAFKKTFSQSPSDFRSHPDWLQLGHKYQAFDNQLALDMKVDIVNFEETKIALLKHRGSPDHIIKTVMQLREWRKDYGLSPRNKTRTFNIIYEDPAVVAPEDFRCDLSVEVMNEIGDNGYGVVNDTLAGGRYAVVRHLGAYDNISRCIYFLYGEWLPDSGEELRDAPCFFQYINHFPDVAEYELITDVYLPIA
ncbi:AraC family transcriptional regulator [Marinomonas transparens]|uniref:AraC family transcriptional regulator n=1 Tax=Marinomonas transparens TaxID=2795388 RepID=A0A934N081_9GAMM|nr:AraC family transcriptional regulator [Marinomonas transparens]MBJ7536452.1 AraC family transcriptional regulator [Marinomonas transparens]